MSDPRIIHVELDERSIIRRHEDIEHEKRVALFDLVASNRFDVAGLNGPFRVRLGVEDNRLAIELSDVAGEPLDVIRLPLGRFKRLVRDYFAICESYFKATRTHEPRGIEAIDMARRGLHNQGAELLQECLAPRVTTDFETARRLFTLICVLHIRQPAASVGPHRHIFEPHPQRTTP